MQPDKEQKRVLKSVLPAAGGYWILWIFGKLDSWEDALIYLGAGIIVTLIMTLFNVLGSKIPQKDK